MGDTVAWVDCAGVDVHVGERVPVCICWFLIRIYKGICVGHLGTMGFGDCCLLTGGSSRGEIGSFNPNLSHWNRLEGIRGL